MNANIVENRFAELVNRSIANNSRKFFEKTRVTVQLGHCSMSVGAKEIVDEVSASLSDPETLTISGCDGACFEAPVVIVGKKRHRFVTLESVPEIVNDHQSEKSHHEDTIFCYGGVGLISSVFEWESGGDKYTGSRHSRIGSPAAVHAAFIIVL